MELLDTKLPPELVEAQIAKLRSESEYFKMQTRKEQYIADQHQIAADESRRAHEAALATNQENRVYDFLGQVTTMNVEAAVQTLARWRRQSKEPITFRISSPGGSIIDGFTLYDYLLALRQEGLHITTAVYGMAASMGGVLLQAGDKRVVGPNAHLMIHEASSQAIGKLSELEDETAFVKRLNTRCWEILSERSKMSKSAIATRASRRDWWLTADECIEKGFADEIGYA